MIKHLRRSLLGLLILTCSQAFALGIGTDIVRILDEDSFNLSIQSNLSRSTAALFEVGAQGSGNVILDARFKAYTGRMYQGINLQIGGQLANANSQSQLALTSAIGWEQSLAPNFVLQGATKIIFLSGDGVQWRPRMGLMFVF